MRPEVAGDLFDAERAFVAVVWPAIAPRIGGGEFEPASGSLDQIAGIDGWQRARRWMRAIAHRVQWGDTDWRTFTIRYRRPTGAPTEWEKLRAGIAIPARARPNLVIHAYVNGPRQAPTLMSAGAAKAESLVAYASGLAELPVRRNPDGVEFIHCDWGAMTAAGYEVRVVPEIEPPDHPAATVTQLHAVQPPPAGPAPAGRRTWDGRPIPEAEHDKALHRRLADEIFPPGSANP